MTRNRLTVLALVMMAAISAAEPGFAQGTPPLETRVRETAARLGSYRKLLDAPDANTRLAALSEMLTSSEAAVRELAFKLGFASADSEMRSLALRQRLLNARMVVVELVREDGRTQQDWEKSIAPYGGDKINLASLSLDPATGELKSGTTLVGRLAGEQLDLRIPNGAVGSLRLGPNATMTGRLSYNPSINHAVKLMLQ